VGRVLGFYNQTCVRIELCHSWLGTQGRFFASLNPAPISGKMGCWAPSEAQCRRSYGSVVLSCSLCSRVSQVPTLPLPRELLLCGGGVRAGSGPDPKH
jgi:hypothetical protein